MKDVEILPFATAGSQNMPDPVWVRINAFLDLKTPNTQRTYVGIIKEWCHFLRVAPGSTSAAESILKASDLHAIAYRKWLQSQPGQRPRFSKDSAHSKDISLERSTFQKQDGLQSTLTNATIAKKFAALRRIYKMLIGAGLLQGQNPFDSDKVPPPPKAAGQKRPTEMVDFKMVAQILTLPDADTPKGVRDRALLAVLFGGGLRRSEAVNLRIGDIKKTAEGTVYLYLRATKSKQDARQALPPWAAETLMDLIRQRKESKAIDADFVFVSYRGRGGVHATNQPLSTSGLYKLFKQYCKRAGVHEIVTPHSARATAITRLLSEGFTHREVQEFSRHASIQMVEVYDKRRISIDESPARDLKYE